ncbi:hypothetical protein SAMN05216184_11585 [Georgenia satyanarayanai]|uniref:Uncharacterized protein n=1 Tax=Georgenia satyanarayanai TaxID=860221 RepID=A0A2Y9AUI7_9MICO|nr:hypothetical protein [Georgenia satyanarayanai]PYF97376.1 hypothetical protein A8987_11585 [Georgenia satyanarayanai]SSA46157.1 hypothetical protein SAMN05216184_11585 [Georgenia satyanarayanai]
MTETTDAELVSVARELYAHAPAEFIATRNARAAATRRAGDRELATRVKALPKASVAAWAVGAVAREHPEDLDALGRLGAELRVAQVAADPAELRALGKRRRELTGAVTRTAARLAEEHGVGLSGAAQEQVEATWSAAVIDRDAERAVRSLLLVRALEPSGGIEGALAVPGAVETAEPEEEPAAPPRTARRTRPAPTSKEPAAEDDDAPPRRAISRRPRSTERDEEPEERTPPRRAISRRSAPEPTPEPADTAREIRRAERELRARERVAEHARAELEDAAEELSRVEAQVLQAAARTEELRRELERLEEQLAELDEERTHAAEEREDAEAREEAARHAVEEARERLSELTD